MQWSVLLAFSGGRYAENLWIDMVLSSELDNEDQKDLYQAHDGDSGVRET